MISKPEGEMITHLDYFKHPEWEPLVSSSAFKPAYTSWAAYRWPLPRDPALAETFGIGTLAHSACLEPTVLEGSFLLLPVYGFRSNADKDRWKRWISDIGRTMTSDESMALESMTKKEQILAAAYDRAEAFGFIAGTQDQYNAARAMAVSVHECHEAHESLDGGVFEQSWRTENRKARVDCLGNEFLVDLKTTNHFDYFERKAIDLLYPESMAFYQSVLEKCGQNIEYWIWIAVEAKPYRLAGDGIPRHLVQVHVASDSLRIDTMDRLRTMLDSWRDCERKDEWPEDPFPVNEISGHSY